MHNSYNIGDKEEFIRILEDIEKRKKTDSNFFQTEEGKKLILNYNSLLPFVSTFHFTKEEREEVERLWNSINQKTNKKPQEREQSILLKTLEAIVNNWEQYSIEEKQKAITKVNEFHLKPDLLQNMTPEEKEKYNQLWRLVKEKAQVKSVTQEELATIQDEYKKGI